MCGIGLAPKTQISNFLGPSLFSLCPRLQITVTNTAGGAKATFVEKSSPITGAKAVKNGAELAGMVEAHLRDSVALAATWHWLEQQVLQ